MAFPKRGGLEFRKVVEVVCGKVALMLAKALSSAYKCFSAEGKEQAIT